MGARDVETRVLVASVAAPFGVRGAVKLKTFTADPMTVGAYGPLETEDGKRRFKLSGLRPVKGPVVIASVEGVNDRDAAESLRGLRLYASRTALPKLEDDEFYLADLVGLDAVDSNGKPLG